MIRVFFINALIAGLFLGIAQYSFATRFVIALAASVSYLAIMFKIAFNRQDIEILQKLLQIVPRNLRPIFSWCMGKIRLGRERHS